MKKNNFTSLWFTLIELLVTITIIGILATGVVSVYTSQTAKARDATRISDINALKGALFSYYSDTGHMIQKPALSINQFNTAAATAITKDRIKDMRDNFLTYVDTIPSDPHSWKQHVTHPRFLQAPIATPLWTYGEYGYATDNWNRYELSIALEATSSEDSWDDPYRYEIWSDLSLDTDAPSTTRYVNLNVPWFTCLGWIGNVFNRCQDWTFVVIKHSSDAFIDAYVPAR